MGQVPGNLPHSIDADPQSAGWGSLRREPRRTQGGGSFSVCGVKSHLLCATNRVPLSYELPRRTPRRCA
jgi:hypothetical protein